MLIKKIPMKIYINIKKIDRNMLVPRKTWRPLKNAQFCSSSRKARILTGGIYWIFRGLKFEPDAEIGQKRVFCKGLTWSGAWNSIRNRRENLRHLKNAQLGLNISSKYIKDFFGGKNPLLFTASWRSAFESSSSHQYQ